MRQFNMNVDREFERDLKKVMKKRGLKHKATAVRMIVREAAASSEPAPPDKPWQRYDWNRLLGAGLAGPTDPAPRFKTDDDLWS